MWLVDLSLAGDSSAAWEAICESIDDTPELPLQELDEIALGLTALQYFEGEIDFSTFLHRAGDHTDPSSCSTDCEYFYQHLNRYESASSPSSYEERAAAEIQQYLKEAIDLAQVAKAQIQSITEQAGGHQPPTHPESNPVGPASWQIRTSAFPGPRFPAARRARGRRRGRSPPTCRDGRAPARLGAGRRDRLPVDIEPDVWLLRLCSGAPLSLLHVCSGLFGPSAGAPRPACWIGSARAGKPTMGPATRTR